MFQSRHPWLRAGGIVNTSLRAVQTKFLWLGRAVVLGELINGWRVCGIWITMRSGAAAAFGRDTFPGRERGWRQVLFQSRRD
jgi:hypothetical protein